MSLQDDIRDKVNQRLRESRGMKWDSHSHPKSYELNNYLLKSGYLLDDVLVHKSNTVELIIKPRVPGYLHPDISHDIAENRFYVNVVDYGYLESSDLEGLLVGYNTALTVMKYLDRLDLSEIRDEYLQNQ